MVRIVTQHNRARYDDLIDRCYRLRHRVFVEERRWEDLRRPDGRDIDQFDTPHAIHVIVTEGPEAIAYTRLLPTMRPHLLSDVYPELLEGAVLPRGPAIYEWTRCCVAPERREGHASMSPAAQQLFLGIAECCVALGIEALSVETHPVWITRLLELGWQARPLAIPTTYKGETVVPMLAGVSAHTVATTRAIFGIEDRVIEDDDREEFEIVRRPDMEQGGY
jgi:acyl-homoserine lactone synthase